MLFKDPGYSASNKLIISVAIADLFIATIFATLISAGVGILGFLVIAIITIANFASFLLLVCTTRRNEKKDD